MQGEISGPGPDLPRIDQAGLSEPLLDARLSARVVDLVGTEARLVGLTNLLNAAQMLEDAQETAASAPERSPDREGNLIRLLRLLQVRARMAQLTTARNTAAQLQALLKKEASDFNRLFEKMASSPEQMKQTLDQALHAYEEGRSEEGFLLLTTLLEEENPDLGFLKALLPEGEESPEELLLQAYGFRKGQELGEEEGGVAWRAKLIKEAEADPPTELSKAAEKLLERQPSLRMQKPPELSKELVGLAAKGALVRMPENYATVVAQQMLEHTTRALFVPAYTKLFQALQNQLQRLKKMGASSDVIAKVEKQLMLFKESFPVVSEEETKDFSEALLELQRLLMQMDLPKEEQLKEVEEVQEQLQSGIEDLEIQKGELDSSYKLYEPLYREMEGIIQILQLPEFSGEQVKQWNERLKSVAALSAQLPEEDQEVFMDFMDEAQTVAAPPPPRATAEAPRSPPRPPPRPTSSVRKKAYRAYHVSMQRTYSIAGMRRAVTRTASYGRTLPDAFRHAILTTFMPRQEREAKELHSYLYFLNFATKSIQACLKPTTTWGNIKNQNRFSFSEWLAEKRVAGDYQYPVYQVTLEEMRAKLDGEGAKAKQDLDNLDLVIRNLRNKLAQLERDMDSGLIEKPEGEKLKEQLTGYLAKANSLRPDLDRLQRDLGMIRLLFNRYPSYPQWVQFTGPPGMLPALGALETKMRDELPAFPTLMKDQLQSYSSLAQQQQLKLQMQMTLMQQEWTAVTTALQTLNRSYMFLAKAINSKTT